MDGFRIGGWTLPFKVMGVTVRVQLAWLLVALLVGWSLAMGSLPVVYAGLTERTYWAMAAMIMVGLGLSILLHEFAHTLVGRALGVSVDRITLFIFGGVAELHEEPKTAVSELGMALAGPVFSVLLCGILAFTAGATELTGAPVAVVGSLTFVATLNLIMAVFNLLPAFPLDGGRVVRATLWMLTGNLDRATRIATGLGQVLAVLLIAGGVVQAVLGNLEGGLWTLLIGIFLQYAARSAQAEADSRRQLAGRPLSAVMVRQVESVPSAMTLEQFFERHLAVTHHGLYPVVDDGTWQGVVEPVDILRAPRELWRALTVGEICRGRDFAATASPSDDAAEATARMQRERWPELLVIDQGRVVGLVTLRDLAARLALERRFRDAAGRPAAQADVRSPPGAWDARHVLGSR